MKVEPHVARRVRDTTLKAVADGQQTMDLLIDTLTSWPPDQMPTRSNAVFFFVKRFYKILKKSGVAVCKMTVKAKSAKGHLGAVVEWREQGGLLFAVAYKIHGHPRTEIDYLLDVEVARHAIERVSERLGTIDPKVVRNELAAPVGALLLHDWDEDAEGYYARTPNGLAIVCKGDDGCVYIPTWISSEMATPEQIEGEWSRWDSVQGVSIETATGFPVFRMREIKTD